MKGGTAPQGGPRVLQESGAQDHFDTDPDLDPGCEKFVTDPDPDPDPG